MMNTKVTCAFLMLLTVAVSCSKDEDAKTPTKEEMLAGTSSKNWKLTASSDDATETDESCKSSSTINSDNVYVFKSNGELDLNTGTINEVDGCADCCSDPYDLIGKWKTFSNGDSLSITFDHFIVGGIVQSIPTDEIEEDHSKIKSLTETSLILEEDGATITFTAIK